MRLPAIRYCNDSCFPQLCWPARNRGVRKQQKHSNKRQSTFFLLLSLNSSFLFYFEVVGVDNYSVAALSAGAAHSLALTFLGKLLSFGSNANGILGLGFSVDVCTPTLLPAPPTVQITAVSAKGEHTLLLGTSRLLGTDSVLFQPIIKLLALGVSRLGN